MHIVFSGKGTGWVTKHVDIQFLKRLLRHKTADARQNAGHTVGKGRIVYTFSGCPAFVFRLHDDLTGFAVYQ